MNEQIKNDLENYERVQLKLLTYRKEDILDLLSSLKNMGKMQGTVVKLGDLKKKQESLQGELLNIDDELFELEKKYGEFKVKQQVVEEAKKADTSYENLKKSETQDLKPEFLPKVEESSLTNSHIQSDNNQTELEAETTSPA